MAGRWRALVVVALLLAGFALKGALIAPPQVAQANQSGTFNTDRTLARLQRILGDERPHPVDSAADDAVRDRLIAELRAIGLQPRVQEAMDCSAIPKSRAVSCSRVRNVIAIVRSLRPGAVLLLNAHYDSTPTGPGAADDGLGVATLLEVGAILKASPPPRPVALLFNEGEEFGLNGAHAFVRDDPLARQVNALVNIDVRGVTGPALMYETSDPNGAAMRLYASAARRPYANSISTDFAKLIPNTTDVVFFKPQGWTLFNYGIIGNETRYHSPGDTIAALERNSLAHVGSEVLAATRAMAAAPDPAAASSGRTVFTDIAGRAFVRLPLAAAAVALALLLIAGFVLAWRRQALGRPLLVAAAVTTGGIVAAGVVATALGWARAGDFWRAYPLVAYLAVYASLLLAMAAIYARLGRGADRSHMRAAAWLLILIVGSAASVALPGAMIFFLAAPAIAVVAIALSLRSESAAAALAAGAIIVQFLMLAQLLALIETLLIDGPLWAVAPLAALAVLPALVELDAADLRPSLVLSAVTLLAFVGGALVVPRANAERPLGFSIDYFRDADAKTANWAVATKQAPLPAGFPGKWKKGVMPYNARTRWIATAPLLETPIPQARVTGSAPAGPGRRIRIVLSPGGGNNIAIRFGKDAMVLALGLPGAAVAIPARGEPDKALLRCTGRSCNGLEIEALLGDRKPVTVELFSTRFGLPPEGRALLAARPRLAGPQYAPDQAITLIKRRV
ncbi:MAG: hypothetical protein QOK41_1046 [Sphingomonadales bacterium]|nr:hypothetical protein [Sphingomonadales bacterium]